MSKVRINDLAREMEVKSRQILDLLAELGLASGKTHSSSLEDYEADKVRAQFESNSGRSSQGSAASRASQGQQPKIDLSHVSKPGDVLKAILANKQKEEQEARASHAPIRPQPSPVVSVAKPAAPATPVAAAAPPVVPARPEPRRIVPQPRSAPPIVVAPPAQPAIASRPPSGAVVAKPPAGAVAAARPTVVVAPHVAVVVKAQVAPAAPVAAREEHPRAAEKPAAAKAPVAPATAPSGPAVHDVTASVQAAPAATLSASAAEPTALAPSTFAEPSEAIKETQVSAPVDVLEPESAVASPSRTQDHAATPPSAPPVRRMVMPQTGPRPVYKAPIVQPSAVVPGTGNQAAGAGIVRGRPIFDRRPASGGTSGPGSSPERTPGATSGAPGSP